MSAAGIDAVAGAPRRVAILQSAYIPWKGYFDLVRAVDAFVLYDEVQFTKHDWRNRNRIKTPQGCQWLTVPVGPAIHRRIDEVVIADRRWQARHWKTLVANYGRAAGFEDVADALAPHWLDRRHDRLSDLNRDLLEACCALLGIDTPIHWSTDLGARGDADRSTRLADLCAALGADTYVSGPAARDYLDTGALAARGIATEWFAYGPWPEYPQPWGPFVHEVSVLDLLFACGKNAARFLGPGRR